MSVQTSSAREGGLNEYVGDRWRCEPLTVMDAVSRYLLGLEATGSTADEEAWPVFERLFEENGLP